VPEGRGGIGVVQNLQGLPFFGHSICGSWGGKGKRGKAGPTWVLVKGAGLVQKTWCQTCVKPKAGRRGAPGKKGLLGVTKVWTAEKKKKIRKGLNNINLDGGIF